MKEREEKGLVRSMENEDVLELLAVLGGFYAVVIFVCWIASYYSHC